VLKLVAPPFHAEHETEVVSLRTLSAHPEIPSPALLVRGELGGWPYLVETRMPGTTVRALWPSLSEPQRHGLLAEIGALLARLHRIPPGGLAEIVPPWETFLAREVAACPERQRRWGVPAHLVDEIPSYILSAGSLGGAALFLHADATPGNLLVSDDGHLCALVDFGDATVGHREYDLLVPALFLARGDAPRLSALFLGYGYEPSQLDDAWRRRLTALSLIHRFNDMTRFLPPEIAGGAPLRSAPPSPPDLHAWAAALWPA